MTWRFADGTVVEPGGVVEGATHFAQLLRSRMAGARVVIWPAPSPARDLDPNDVAVLDLWLTNMSRAYSVEMTERPKNVPPLPPPPWGEDDEESADADGVIDVLN
jgi:hypothetical protein